MSFFRKLKEKHNAQRIRKSEMMQGFTMQAELRETIVGVKLLQGSVEKTQFLVEYADGERKAEEVENNSNRFAELAQYLG